MKGLNYDDFVLTSEGLKEEDRSKAIKNLQDYLKEQKGRFLGYQVNHNMTYDEDLKPFLNMHINNVGDPFIESNYTMSSKAMEKAVLDYYAKLWNGITPHDKENPESYWGYTLSMGSTEGNVYAIWNARDYLSGKELLIDESKGNSNKVFNPSNLSKNLATNNENTYTPIAFYSQDTHYSIKKAMRVLSFETFYEIGSSKYHCPLRFPEDYPSGYSKGNLGEGGWPLEVPSNHDGSIHIPSLTKLIDFFTGKGYPVFVCFNYGTTFKGAYDQVEKAVNALVPILKKNKMYEREIPYKEKSCHGTVIRNGFWFHVDGALGAAYMPYIEKSVKEGKLSLPEGYDFPKFDFRIPEVNSIVMSIHKWVGAPFSCGLLMTKTKYQLLPPANPMYIGSPDTTFAGSRNGLAPIVLWNFLAKHSEEKLKEMALKTEKIAQYAERRLKELEKVLQIDLWVERSPLALTVRFRKPNDQVIFSNTLSCETVFVGEEKRDYAHVYAMEHVTEEMIDLLIEDLRDSDAYQEFNDSPLEVEIHPMENCLGS